MKTLMMRERTYLEERWFNEQLSRLRGERESDRVIACRERMRGFKRRDWERDETEENGGLNGSRII